MSSHQNNSISRFSIVALSILTFHPQIFGQVKGKVVDENGKPVPQASVVVGDSLIHSKGTVRAFDPIKTDAQGAFAIEMRASRRGQALMALDGEGKRGGIVIVTSKNQKQDQTIQLRPLTHLHGNFLIKELDEKPPYTNVQILLLPSRMLCASSESNSGEFSFMLPPGRYSFMVYGIDVQDYKREITIKAGQGELALGTIDMKPTNLARHYGKAPPPLNIGDARGVGKDFKLSSLKGKWVLLEFWAYW